MNDRELLEAVAKAIGMNVFDWIPGRSGFAHGDSITNRWNPLTDDGDALRLAVNRGFVVNVWRTAGKVFAGKEDGDGATEEFFDDASAEVATRRAIVRAAAAMDIG